MRSYASGGLLHEVQLHPGEVVYRKDYASPMALPWPIFPSGELYLTNQRLIWVRAHVSIMPWFRHSIEIPLKEIRRCRVSRFWRRMGPMGGAAVLLVEDQKDAWILTFTRRRGPLYWPSVNAPEEWLHAIRDINDVYIPDDSEDTPSLQVARSRVRRISIGFLAFFATGAIASLANFVLFDLQLLIVSAFVLITFGALIVFFWSFFKSLHKVLEP